MARLNSRTHSDMRDDPVTAIASKKVSTVHSWGMTSDKDRVVTVTTRWNKEQPKPTVIIELEQGVAYEVIGPKGNTISLSR